MAETPKTTRVRGPRAGRRWVFSSLSVLGAMLVLASTAWACSVINGTTEAYQDANSNGQEVSTLSRGTTYYFRGNGGAPISSNFTANLWLMQPTGTGDDCMTPNSLDPTQKLLAQTTVDHLPDKSPGDYPPDRRTFDQQASQGNQPTVAGTIPSTYPTGSAKLCFTNEQDWHSVPKAVTVI